MSYIKLHRKILDWEWYTDANTYRLFTHLLYRANFKSNRWMGIDILPGQLVIGRKELARELKLSEQEIRTSLSKLKSTSEITIKSTNKFSIVTICKWEDYQMNTKEDQPTDQPTDQQSSNQQSTTLKEGKEGKEEKNNISASFDEFRKAYPGKKLGLKTELDVFLKKNKPEVVSLLLPALKKEIVHRENLSRRNEFIPSWKNLSTWIGKRCWEQEFAEEKLTPEPKQQSPQITTLSEFDFDSLNAQRLAVLHSNKTKAQA